MAGRGRTLLQALEYWGKEQPAKVLHTFLDDHGVELESLTYRGLMEKSGALAAHMLAPTSEKGLGLTPGERVLLVYPPSLDFMVAFYACVRARLIAVPVFPPGNDTPSRRLARSAVPLTSSLPPRAPLSPPSPRQTRARQRRTCTCSPPSREAPEPAWH